MNTETKNKLISNDPEFVPAIEYIKANKANLPNGTILNTAREFGIHSSPHASRVMTGQASPTNSNVAFLWAIYLKVKQYTERFESIQSQVNALQTA